MDSTKLTVTMNFYLDDSTYKYSRIDSSQVGGADTHSYWEMPMGGSP